MNQRARKMTISLLTATNVVVHILDRVGVLDHEIFLRFEPARIDGNDKVREGMEIATLPLPPGSSSDNRLVYTILIDKTTN